MQTDHEKEADALLYACALTELFIFPHVGYYSKLVAAGPVAASREL